MIEMQSFGVVFSTLEPQLIHVSKLVTDELRQIKSKEDGLDQRFRHQVDEYTKVKFMPISSDVLRRAFR